MRSRPKHDDFMDIVKLDKIDEDTFSALSPEAGHNRIFGGQFVSQSLMAACLSVENVNDCPPHSLHGHFIRSGDPALPLTYTVDRLRDSRAFHTRNVSAWQSDKLVFSLVASFHRAEDGFAHQDPIPSVPKPDDISRPSVEDVEARFGEMPQQMKERWDRPSTHEARFVTDRFMFAPQIGDPDLQIWWRSSTQPPLPDPRDDPVIHLVDLACVSDMMYMDTAMIPHGKSLMSPDVLGVSICHSVWIHEPVDMRDWHLFSGHSGWAAHGRGHIHGHVYREDGTRVATTAQECLLRHLP